MKFAKELEQSLVPEWRVKYLDYRTGKKLVKGITRSLNRVNNTPATARSFQHAPWQAPAWRNSCPSPIVRSNTFTSTTAFDSTASQPQPANTSHKAGSSSVRNSKDSFHGVLADAPDNGGSSSRPSSTEPVPGRPLDRHAAFRLPEPAIAEDDEEEEEEEEDPPIQKPRNVVRSNSRSILRQASKSQDSPPKRMGLKIAIPAAPARSSTWTPATPSANPLRRLFTNASMVSAREPGQLDGLLLAQERERAFFRFLDDELAKVEAFYKEKEEQAGKRLDLLRAQLHEMRTRRLSEMSEQRSKREKLTGEGSTVSFDDASTTAPTTANSIVSSYQPSFKWMEPLKSMVPYPRPGPNSRALVNMANSPQVGSMSEDSRRDYIRRPQSHQVPYRTAKRKLKRALQEYYRSLELLKAYALLNRMAFRKLNKKYDKVMHMRPSLRYVNEKVNKAWFVQSEVLEGYISAVEDLYARYFEKGQHKIAAGKLRRFAKSNNDVSGTVFRNGLLIGLAMVFAVQGLVNGVELLSNSDPVIRTNTNYLLQIYGGYFLILLLFSLFCANCWIWTTNKVNYQFIFELDPRHQLDWRQMSEFPSFMSLLFGFFMWLNFSRYGSASMFLYYPIILIAISLLIICFPAPIFRPSARKWFVYSHWRLLLAGFYPVEFRDFFLGDIYCSLTYALCNIALVSCLYSKSWKQPEVCNSSHSPIMGFLAALPPIWRSLQCLRRYYDTRNWFPHLINCGKYAMSIMAAISLSMYRIDRTHTNFALFVSFGCINGIYTAIWDLFMDFSVLQPGARKYLLRDILGLKKQWVYYVIMTLDPMLRFSWIFYAILRNQTQHSAAIAFGVAMAEVIRRGMWTLLRVENEHCSNVAQYKASRDIPLPYKIELCDEMTAAAGKKAHHFGSPDLATASTESGASPLSGTTIAANGVYTSGAQTSAPNAADVEQHAGGSSSMQHRRNGTTGTVGTIGMAISRIMAEAHRQDFEKRRKPEDEEPEMRGGADEDDEFYYDDDDDDEMDQSDGPSTQCGIPASANVRSSMGFESNSRAKD
ncbi:Protein SYG1 -like protein [Ceratocystis fimbriata CBS 114723]|uniref:Protein SYG1-like protein n=1 Tax=Ceratocystis fimbriata CBS 114723 TaxID=1035309 RepID=A0A2C5XKB1_9PEZI|nr:Protein SYG1 -like protein [Ceratocystis fimbriata CBS 114723]